MRFVLFLLTLIASVSAPAAEVIRIEGSLSRPVQASVFPPAGDACQGIAIISHGAGGSELGYRYLGEALSSLGYLAIVPGHPESGREVVREAVRFKGLRDALADLIGDPQAYRARFGDIDVSGSWAASRCTGGTRLILVGHSMGAATVMLEAGAKNRLGLTGRDGFDAYIALSPQGAGSIFEPDGWSQIRRPVLLVTGTRDTELGTGRWESRMEPFASLPAGCVWLAVLDGATHMQFAGIGDSKAVEASTIRVIRAFLDALAEPGCQPKFKAPGIDLRHK
ncbi:MAG: alpha/beta hydrolase family protein [Burkholderiaceae bacterium]